MKKKRYTLEIHLHNLSELDMNCKGLESVYNLQKRKLERYMSSVVTTYPTYSTHDTVHSMNIVSAIESILGKERIKSLSGIDTFLILMCAYMHDIGMLYTEDEVRETWNSKEFSEFLTEQKGNTGELKKAAELVDGNIKVLQNNEIWPLEIRQSVTILMMEYFRPKHGARIEKMTEKGTGGITELLRVEDSFLPERIIKMINAISMAHTWSFEKMMKVLPKTDSFSGEDFHPRLIAFLLRIGDLCDMDNNRFNQIGIAAFGTLGDENLAHYFKHKSVDTLYISPNKIKVVANVIQGDIKSECKRVWMNIESEKIVAKRCEKIFHQTVREHINWKNWMEKEIIDVKLNVHRIFPKEWQRKVPEIEYIIKINGKETISSNENLRFMFSPEKAFNLIENISIYENEKFIFIRELIQNALDASKIQMWREIYGDNGESIKGKSPFEIAILYPEIYKKYRISISVDYDSNTRIAEFKIKDSGIGISVDELKTNILTTGNSWSKREAYRTELSNMPKWLKPTGAFGIGLHTVFSVTDQMQIITKSEKENLANEITLCSGKKDGYAFCQKIEKNVERGSCFSFSFELTEEQEKQFFEESGENTFLQNIENELENTIISEIKAWCMTPLFPIYVNNELVVPELVESISFQELGMAEKRNIILGKEIADERYEFAFSRDYQRLRLLDKKNELIMSIVLEEDDVDNLVVFKGIKLRDNLELLKNFIGLKLEMLDILSGESDEMIDASRTNLTLEAKKNMIKITLENLEYTKKIYLLLMEQVQSDEESNALLLELNDCATKYLDKKITKKQLLRQAHSLQEKYLYQEDFLQDDKLKYDTITYMIGLKIADYALLQSVKKYKKAEEVNPLKVVENMELPVLELVDEILKRWNTNRNVYDAYDQRYYFDYQLQNIMMHYLNIYTMLIINVMLEDSESIDNIEQWENVIRKKYQNICLFAGAWSETSNLWQHVVEKLGRLSRNSLFRTYDAPFTNFICKPYYLLFPSIKEVFEEGYVAFGMGKDGVLLELFKPYLPVLFDIPKGEKEISQFEKRIWKEQMSNTIYGSLSFDAKKATVVEELLEKEKFSISLPSRDYLLEWLPFLCHLPVVHVKENSRNKHITFRFYTTSSSGIIADEETIVSSFLHFWQVIEAENGAWGPRRNEYVDIVGFKKYERLMLQSTRIEYDKCLGISYQRFYIPVWDYSCNIREYLDNYRCNENRTACLQGIVNSSRFDAVTEFIWKKKKLEGNEVSLEKIREQYEMLLHDMLDIWFEQMPRG